MYYVEYKKIRREKLILPNLEVMIKLTPIWVRIPIPYAGLGLASIKAYQLHRSNGVITRVKPE